MVQIKLAFRIVIDQNSTLAWDKYIFEDTYFEYRVQHQVFEQPELPGSQRNVAIATANAALQSIELE